MSVNGKKRGTIPTVKMNSSALATHVFVAAFPRFPYQLNSGVQAWIYNQFVETTPIDAQDVTHLNHHQRGTRISFQTDQYVSKTVIEELFHTITSTFPECGLTFYAKEETGLCIYQSAPLFHTVRVPKTVSDDPQEETDYEYHCNDNGIII